MSLSADVRVPQFVNEHKGIHVMLRIANLVALDIFFDKPEPNYKRTIPQ